MSQASVQERLATLSQIYTSYSDSNSGIEEQLPSVIINNNILKEHGYNTITGQQKLTFQETEIESTTNDTKENKR